jgi:hypothetical protein
LPKDKQIEQENYTIMKTPQEFIDDLKEYFLEKGKGFTVSQRDSYFDTIKAYLQKKNLVVVSKVEYQRLQTNEE